MVVAAQKVKFTIKDLRESPRIRDEITSSHIVKSKKITTNLTNSYFAHILIAFYHLPISLVLFTRLLIDASKCAQNGLNYIVN